MQETSSPAAQLPWESESQEILGRRKTETGAHHSVPIFTSAFPLDKDATRVHCAQVVQIGGVWASGAQPYEAKHPRDLEWESKELDFEDVRYHTSPNLQEETPRYMGGPHFLAEDSQAAENIASVYCEPRLKTLAYKHKNMTIEALPPYPQKIDKVFIHAGPVTHSGRIFISREDAMEDAKILAAIMDSTNESQKQAYWSDLQDARPTPAFDIENPDKVDLGKITPQTSMVQTAYEAGIQTPSLLIAAAAITGAIPADDPRIAAVPAEQHSEMVDDIRSATTDRMDAVRSTAAGKTLRENKKSIPARMNALETLEKLAVKQGNSQSVGKVLGAAEIELSVPNIAHRHSYELGA